MSNEELKRPRMQREVESLIQFNQVLDGFPTTPRTSRQDGAGAGVSGGSSGKRTRRDREDDDMDSPTLFISPPVGQRRFPRKLLTRPTGVGIERIVVFVDPLKDTIPYWNSAMVVPTVEYDQAMGHARPGECIVRYFSDLKFSVIPVSRLAVFDEEKEPYISFKHMDDFQADKGTVAALRMLRHGVLPNGFKWPLWDDASGPGIEESESDRKTRSGGRGSTKRGQDREEAATPTPKGAASGSAGAVELAVEDDVTAFEGRLKALLAQRDTPIKKTPTVASQPLDAQRLFAVYNNVIQRGGYEEVTSKGLWRGVYDDSGLANVNTGAVNTLQSQYERYLLPYEEKYFSRRRTTSIPPAGASSGSGKSRLPQIGDRVSVFTPAHGKEYAAKIIDVRGDAEPEYFVHYQGWNAHYDEWVAHSTLQSFLDDDAAIAKHGKDTPKSGSLAPAASGADAAGSKTPRKSGGQQAPSPKEEPRPTPSRRSPSPPASASKRRRTDDSPAASPMPTLAQLAAPPPRRAAAIAAAAAASSITAQDRRSVTPPDAVKRPLSTPTTSRRGGTPVASRTPTGRSATPSGGRSSRATPGRGGSVRGRGSDRRGDGSDDDDNDDGEDDDGENEDGGENGDASADEGRDVKSESPLDVDKDAPAAESTSEKDAAAENDESDDDDDASAVSKGKRRGGRRGGVKEESAEPDASQQEAAGEPEDAAADAADEQQQQAPDAGDASDHDDDDEEADEEDGDGDDDAKETAASGGSAAKKAADRKRRRGASRGAPKRKKRRSNGSSQGNAAVETEEKVDESGENGNNESPDSPQNAAPATTSGSKLEHATLLALALRVPDDIREKLADHKVDWSVMFPKLEECSREERIDSIERKMNELKAQYKRHRQVIERIVRRTQRASSDSRAPAASTLNLTAAVHD